MTVRTQDYLHPRTACSHRQLTNLKSLGAPSHCPWQNPSNPAMAILPGTLIDGPIHEYYKHLPVLHDISQHWEYRMFLLWRVFNPDLEFNVLHLLKIYQSRNWKHTFSRDPSDDFDFSAVLDMLDDDLRRQESLEGRTKQKRLEIQDKVSRAKGPSFVPIHTHDCCADGLPDSVLLWHRFSPSQGGNSNVIIGHRSHTFRRW